MSHVLERKFNIGHMTGQLERNSRRARARALLKRSDEMQMADEEGLYKRLERRKVLAIEIEADSRNGLLARATTALSRIMVQPDNVKAADWKEIEIGDDTDVEMMHNMLGAALNVFAAISCVAMPS